MAKKRKRLDCRAEADEVIRLYRVEKQVWKKERLQVIKLLLETEKSCLLYTSPSPRDQRGSRMPSSA